MAVYSYARLGKGRLNAFRLGYRQPSVLITVNGTNRHAYTRLEGLTVRDYLDGQPNIATMRVSGFTPTIGHEVKIGLGSTQASCLVFAGHIQQMAQVYEGVMANIAYDLTCVSYEWLLNRRKVNARFTSTSASTVVASLMSTFTTGFTTTNVDSGLDSLDEITFTNEDVTDALDRIAKRIGGYWYVDAGRDLHFFVTAQDSAHDITTANIRTARNVAQSTDLSQVRTRIFYEGGGGVTPIDVPAGSTVLPVDDLTWYDDTGGLVQVGTQRITYTGVQAGGAGGLVGSSVVPSNAPTLALAFGAGLGTGAYGYAVTFVTASGETTPGPTGYVTTEAGIADPTTNGTASTNPVGADTSLDASALYGYKYTFKSGSNETLPGPAATVTTGSGTPGRSVLLTRAGVQAAPSGFDVQFYRTEGGGSTYLLMPGASDGFYSDDSTYYRDVFQPDASLGAAAPASNSTARQQVSLTGIAIGPSGTTSRKVYRTAGGGAQLKLLTTLADNTTTTYADSTADGSLGANAPSSDTSGLVSASGTVLAGATSIPVGGTGPFLSGGGYALVAGQQIRYAAKSGTALTGVPSSGDGSLGATLNYGTEIITVPMLTGVPASSTGSIVSTIAANEAVNVVAQADDLTAQSNFSTFVGGDGIVEETLQDQRLSRTEAYARAVAKLYELKDPLVTVRYGTRDQTTRSGYEVTLTLDAPTSISGTFKIQSVLLADFDPVGVRWPLRQVEASSRRLAFENILRLIKAA